MPVMKPVYRVTDDSGRVYDVCLHETKVFKVILCLACQRAYFDILSKCPYCGCPRG